MMNVFDLGEILENVLGLGAMPCTLGVWQNNVAHGLGSSELCHVKRTPSLATGTLFDKRHRVYATGRRLFFGNHQDIAS